VNEGSGNLLSQLRDIHAAAEPGWWPPAPGWWVLALLAAVCTALVLRHAYRFWSVMHRRRRLLTALDAMARDIDPREQPNEYLSRMNRLFRVVALRAFPGSACARLQGSEWVHFIQASLPEGVPLQGLRALASGPYQFKPDFDAASLQQLARRWVRKYG